MEIKDIGTVLFNYGRDGTYGIVICVFCNPRPHKK